MNTKSALGLPSPNTVFVAVWRKAQQHAKQTGRHQQTRRATRQAEQQTLGDHLPDKPRTAGADGRPDCKFAAPQSSWPATLLKRRLISPS